MKASRGHPCSTIAAQRVLAKAAASHRHPIGAENLFVCVRQRHGKSSSCAGSGSLVLLQQMQAMLSAEGIEPEELCVRPTGCLDLCKRGPVMVAQSAGQIRKQKPSSAAKHGKQQRVYTRVGPKTLRTVLRETLART